MSKQYNIRWSEADNQQLTKAVKNFNAKVKRLEKKFIGQDVVIPEKVSVREMREVIGTRRDLQRELKSLQSFTQRGSEELVKTNTDSNIIITKWQKAELEKRAKIINKARDIRKEEYIQRELVDKGKPLGYNRAQMGDVKLLQFEHTSPVTKSMEKADFKAKMKHFRAESQDMYWNKRDKMMIDNYIQTLKDNFNYRDVKDVIAKIQSMSIEEAKEIIYADPQGYNTAYPLGDDEDYKKYVKHLREMWKLPAEPEKSTSSRSKSKKSKSKKSKGKKK